MECKRAIARRVYRTKTGAEVVARIFEPFEVSADDWRCEFEIAGLNPDFRALGPGVDSMDALSNALGGLRIQLERIGEELVWIDAEPGVSGIAHTIPSAFGPSVEKYLIALVRQRVDRLVAEKLRQEKEGAGQAATEPDSDPEIVRLAAEKLREDALEDSHPDSDQEPGA